MCEEAAFTACIIEDLMNCIPEEVDKSELNSLFKKSYYTAPEACDGLWRSLFNILRAKYDDGEEFQKEMCRVYNKGYNDFVDRYLK